MNTPYLPHTENDINEMLKACKAGSIEELFSDIPAGSRFKGELPIPASRSELETSALLKSHASRNASAEDKICFLGAGAYDHFIPSVVHHMAGRSEFYTAYTPYQAEISQGILQVFFEYQSMIAELTGLDVSNASMYDGATALVEAVLMSVTPGKKKVYIPAALHPEYKKVLNTYTAHTGLSLIEMPVLENGRTDFKPIEQSAGDTACVVLQQPNFFGVIEDPAEFSKLAVSSGGMLIACVDPISLSVLASPGQYKADIAVGEGQSLGNSLNFGGPYIGFFAAKKELVRRMPGRIIGETLDKDGKRAFTLTLQTREQHIRREKATSNICSNEALCALNATVYLSALGKEGFIETGEQCLAKAGYAAELIGKIPGFALRFSAPFFKEFAVKCPAPVSRINEELLNKGIIGGFDLGTVEPRLKDTMLICVTEKRSVAEIELLAKCLKEII